MDAKEEWVESLVYKCPVHNTEMLVKVEGDETIYLCRLEWCTAGWITKRET